MYQVTAEGLDPRTPLVSHIMTPNPMVTRDTTRATQALQLMVEKHFRHLVSLGFTNVNLGDTEKMADGIVLPTR